MVDELGRRLSTLKQQATKAQRYREWTQQLMQKRTLLGQLDLLDLESQRHSLDQRYRDATVVKADTQAQAATIQESLNDQQTILKSLLDELSTYADKLTANQKEHIQASSERVLIEQRQAEWETQCSTLLERTELLERRVTIGEEEIVERKRIIEQQESLCTEAASRTTALDADVHSREEILKQLRRQRDNRREEQETLRQQLARIQVDASSQFNALESTETEILRLRQQIADKSQTIEKLQRDFEQLSQELNTARQDYNSAETNKEIAKKQHDEIVEQRRRQQQICLELQTRIQGLNERWNLLAQLEDQFANAGRGGQQLMRSALEMEKSRSVFDANHSSIRGIVADLIQTELHLAPLVDVALGTYADAIVMSDGKLIDWIHEGRLMPEGRVTLLRLDRLPTRRTGERIQLDGLRGVLGRADRLVRFDVSNEPLVRSLLGTTWFVESLATALDLSHFRGAGLRFVTAECQLIDSDGSITIGSLQTGLGLVSRRSEMQSTTEQRDAIEISLAEARMALDSIEAAQQSASERVHQTDVEVVASARRVAGIEQKLRSLEDQQITESTSLNSLNGELDSKTKQRDQIDQSMIVLDRERLDLEQSDASLVYDLEQFAQKIRDRETECQQAQQSLVEHRIESARQEQRLDGLRLTLEQLLQDASERTNHLQAAKEQSTQLEGKIAQAKTTQGILSRRIEQIESDSTELEHKRNATDQERLSQEQVVNASVKQRDSLSRQLEKIEDRIAAMDQDIQRLSQQRKELLARYLDEYQIDLSLSVAEAEMLGSHKRHEIEADLAQLRHDIASAGSVNMEALDELEDLEKRHERLASQEKDLIDAKDGLLRTMDKIDEDARSLFRETLETIRVNFQQLYRKSFGGGSADIILEDPDDPESGIEILATPPGKTTFSNSLLSGGEKALTAVSLIMAFFQYRPSPFCILDEVDAPFDEANIGRFVAVLNEFLDTTKFIIVTHSKKTMTVANMIYGVTMQESGVSRQVAVKFEEVDDRGEVVRRAA
jgi:chromosome segregation protein